MTSHGDIRSTIVYNNGYVYFTTKGGYLYRVQMNADGTFGSTSSYNLGGMATASPVVYKGRIYVGVCGNGGQFNSDGGHHFAVLNETASGISLAYNVSIPGYPQAAPLLSTAYENQDYNGDGQADGRVYLYFTYNAKPGGIYMLSDEPGQTSGTAVELFRPASNQQEYCISTICADREGTLYYKNDSNYLMALETNLWAYLNSVTATADTGKVTWPSAFRKDTLKYNLTVAENASKVTFALKAPEGCTITVNGQAYAGSFVADVSSGSTDIKVTVSGQGKSREYTFHISQDISTPVLANMTLSTSNTYSNTANRISLSPEFSSATTSYRAIYKESREFLNIFAEPADSSASVTAVGIRGTSKVTVLGKVTGSGAAHRIAMYFDKTNPEAEAEVKVTVTTKSGKTTDYTIVVQRTDTPSPTPTVTPVPATPTPVPPTPAPTEVPGRVWPLDNRIRGQPYFAPETQKRTQQQGKTETPYSGK
ncbi:MAG: cadherin-like beta sandwich domain-containing protein [Blautia faecis]